RPCSSPFRPFSRGPAAIQVSRMYKFHSAAVDLAIAQGLILREGGCVSPHPLPQWLGGVQEADGSAAVERRRQIIMPAAVREWYQMPGLMFVAVRSGFFDDPDEPIVEALGVRRYLTVCEHAHSGDCWAVALGMGDDPPVYNKMYDKITEGPASFS